MNSRYDTNLTTNMTGFHSTTTKMGPTRNRYASQLRTFDDSRRTLDDHRRKSNMDGRSTKGFLLGTLSHETQYDRDKINRNTVNRTNMAMLT